MVNLDLNEYSVIDNVLSELKVTPDKIELPIPAYYTKVKPQERKKTRRGINGYVVIKYLIFLLAAISIM
jgi:hypothetical protein